MMRLNLDHFRLHCIGASGHEHRVRPIIRRALELLRLRLRDNLLASDVRLDEMRLASLSIPVMPVNLAMMSDEAVAEKLADAMYAALWARWQEG